MTPPGSHQALGRSREAQFRHDLLTPVNHIMGYSSLLLDAAQDQGKTDLWPALHNLVEQGRHVLETIETWMPSCPSEDFQTDYQAMADELATPAGKILQGCADLETTASTSLGGEDPNRDEFLSDLSGIRVATLRLVDMARVGPTDAGSVA